MSDKSIHLENETTLDEFKKVDRIRGGKLQKKVKVATKLGHKMVDGKEVRMKASEKLKRKKGAKIAARKRKGRGAQSLRKRKKSFRLRKMRKL